MNKHATDLRIDAGRFRATFEELAAIGATPKGGVDRPAFSKAHLEARRWLLETAKQAGLETSVDGAGNHSVLLRCGPPGAPILLLGSHLDSVPNAGRYDGALGVIAALEVLQTVRQHGLSLASHLEAIDFTDEEGHYTNFVGSLGLTGQLKAEHIQSPRGGRRRFHQALNRARLSEESLFVAGRSPASIAGYLELHIEQGRRLVEQKVPIGIVTSIVGIRSFMVHFLGRADHAGTTPLNLRRDAAQGASAFILAVRETVLREFPDCVGTVGNVTFEPGVFNVVAETASVSLEFRADGVSKLDAMETRLGQAAADAARRFELDLEIEDLDSSPPARMDENAQASIAQACERLDLEFMLMPSGAGHDAQCLATVCPTGMIFVPSVGGHSHSPREHTEWPDCVNGANVLLQAALSLARL
jgi:hydantoinase/carbamoylase family amidase